MDDKNVAALAKGSERYIVIYADRHTAEAMRVIGRLASNPELDFTWYDAAVLSQKIRSRIEDCKLRNANCKVQND